MSYTYSLFYAPDSGPMSSWEAKPPKPLGTVDEVIRRLSEVFPEASMRWFQTSCFVTSENDITKAMEIHVMPEEDGLVRMLMVKRVTRPDLEQLCRDLGVVAVDNQSVELIRV